jgi:hypothetical protein
VRQEQDLGATKMQLLKHLKVGAACFSAALLVSCATNYIPPADDLKPPPLWAGTVELVPASEAIEFRSGVRRNGDWFQKVATKMSREGRIVDEIRYKSPFGKEIIIPANTPVHAMQMSVTQTISYNYVRQSSTNLNANNNPIEWCYSILADTACIFWEGETRARYVTMVPISQRRLIGFSPTGMIGPMPNIVEGNGDFGGPILATQKLADISDTGFSIVSTLKDGREEEKSLGQKRVISWAGSDRVTLELYTFKAVKNAQGKIDAVEISIIGQPMRTP